MALVKLYASMPATDINVVAGISPKIIAEVLPDFTVDDNGVNIPTPYTAAYIKMTEEELIEYKKTIVNELALWKIAQKNILQKH